MMGEQGMGYWSGCRAVAPVVVGERFELRYRIGSGETCELFAAQDLGSGALVALKLLRTDAPDYAGKAARLREAATALARVDSRHVVRVHATGVDERGGYLVLTLLEGATLSRELGRARGIDPERACRIALDVLAALTTLHAAGLTAGVLEPSRVWIDSDDRAVLLDAHRGGDLAADLAEVGTLLSRLINGRTDVVPAPISELIRRATGPLASRYADAPALAAAVRNALDSVRHARRRRTQAMRQMTMEVAV